MKPEIYAKATLTKEQTHTKLKIGCDGIEIQVLDELTISRANGIYRAANVAYDLKGLKDLPVRAVHAPIMCDNGYTVLETIIDPKDMKLLEQVFSIASFYGLEQQRRIPVILHSEMFYYMLADMGNMWSRIVRTIDAMLTRYSNTELLIENVTPLRGIAEGRTLHLSNNFTFDNVRMAVELRKMLGTDRVGTCLDICHALLSKQYVDAIYSILGTDNVPNLHLSEYYIQNAEVLRLVHLSNYEGHGYGNGKHGLSFTYETSGDLCAILFMHQKYAPDIPITITTIEHDYAVCNNYRTTKKMIDEYFS